MRRSLLATLIVTLASPCAIADLRWPPAATDASEMPVVLTPARLRQPQTQVPGSVTVIDRTLIDASGARELYQLLRLVPGMAAVKVDGNVPTVAYHPTQARDTRRMLVLVDGRSVYQPGFARVLWNDIPVALADVERIEISRGPNAAAYGANAYTGIINIITRHPADVTETTVAVGAGNNGVRDARVTDGRQWQGGAFRLTATQRADDGYDARRSTFDYPQRDSKRIETVDTRGIQHLSGRDTLEFFAGGSRSTLQRPVNEALQQLGDYTELPREDNQAAFVQLRWSREISANHHLRMQAYGQRSRSMTRQELCTLDPLTGARGPGGGIFYSREARELYEATGRDLDATLAALSADPGAGARYQVLAGSGAPAFCHGLRQDIREQRADLEIEDTLALHERVRLVSGGSIRHERSASQFFLRGTRDIYSQALFANLELNPVDPVHLNMGGFYQHDGINGSTVSPRMALIWTPAPGHGVRLVRSQAVRNVDVYEERADSRIYPTGLPAEFSDNATAVLGWASPELFVTQRSEGRLEPERILSRELGYFGRVGQFEIDVRFFNESLTKLISRAVSPFLFEARNADRVDHRGWESQWGWRPHRRHLLRLTAARVLTDASVRTERRMIARNSGSLLWRFDAADGWLISTGYYLARDYNDFRYEQATLQLARRQRIGPTELELRAVIEHRISDDPVVFEENRYRDRSHFWLSAALNF